MTSSNIYHISSINQDRQDAIFTMQGIALTNITHNVIREYGKYDDVNYSVNLADIETHDRKLLLSHVLDSGEYEWAMESDMRINAIFAEHAKHLQDLIDSECAEVYREDMEEMGMTSRRHSDNNELSWVRR